MIVTHLKSVKNDFFHFIFLFRVMQEFYPITPLPLPNEWFLFFTHQEPPNKTTKETNIMTIFCVNLLKEKIKSYIFVRFWQKACIFWNTISAKIK